MKRKYQVEKQLQEQVAKQQSLETKVNELKNTIKSQSAVRSDPYKETSS